MKNYIVIALVLMFANHSISQEYSKKDIIGKWKVIEVLKKTENPNLNDLIKSFSTASFQFNEDSSFRISTLNKSKVFDMLINMTRTAKWRLNENNFSVNIGDDLNQFNILKIIILKVDEKIVFHLTETELNLEVVKE